MKLIICGAVGYGGIERIRDLQEFLRENGYEVIDQFRDADYSYVEDFRDRAELSRKIIERDLKRIEEADVLILIADSPSFGASIEAFLFSMKGRTVIAYAENPARSPWSLAFARRICRNREELLKALKEMGKEEIRTIPNIWGEHEAEFIYENFGCICPVTGREDRARITIRYVPDEWLIEYESLDRYFRSFQNREIHHEAVVSEIFSEISKRISPRYLEVAGEFEERSGVRARIIKRGGQKNGI
ncbi:MAG: 7-cyano-7-deazaguanine reductase [Archaeoglobi archaeon]|nr:7-cyano-7-deazaguanine reductase [Archaeoglobi archaeon]MDK2781283.1 7-cyano-7-deazaguanine reductase [Archaeoglobi archaeon]